MTEFADIEKQLKAMATVVNAFKSEAVQLRVVEVLLTQLGVAASSEEQHVSRRPARATRRGRKARPVSADKPASAKPKRAGSSLGASAMITQLLGDGFFKTPRTIGAITEHASTSKGHHFKANECSPTLLRLIRDQKLKRKKNKDSQYEYTQA